jgi:hypothetical protein
MENLTQKLYILAKIQEGDKLSIILENQKEIISVQSSTGISSFFVPSWRFFYKNSWQQTLQFLEKFEQSVCKAKNEKMKEIEQFFLLSDEESVDTIEKRDTFAQECKQLYNAIIEAIEGLKNLERTYRSNSEASAGIRVIYEKFIVIGPNVQRSLLHIDSEFHDLIF